MAAVALARQFLSTRTMSAHFRSLAILQRTLQFSSLFARAASTATAKKATVSKTSTKAKSTAAAKPGPKSKAAVTKKSPGKTAAKPAAKKTAVAKKSTTAKGAAVKKPVAKKPVAKKKPVVKKKPAVKKKPLKKKVVAKKKPVLTDQQKERKTLLTLRQRALSPPAKRSSNGFMFWYKQQAGKKLIDASVAWKNLPQETKEAYERDARAAGALQAPARQKAFDDWVLSHPADTIRVANNARRHLRRLGITRGTTLISDPRRVKGPSAAFVFYVKDQYASRRDLPKGEDGKPSMVAATKALLSEFSNFSPEERKKYDDMAAQDKRRYQIELGKK